MLDFQGLFATIPTPLMVLDRQLCFVAANDSYLAVTNSRWPDIAGRHVFEAFPETPERRAAIEDGFHRALAGEANSLKNLVFAIAQPDGGTRDLYWSCHHVPVRGPDGSVVGVMQNTMDVTNEIAAERMRDAISQEYDHRVRNILTKVSAIARRTARSTATMQQFIADFDPRIAAMARAHQLLVSGGWERLGLAELVDSELQPYDTGAGGQISVDGANLALNSRVAQAIGLALHELATNALKHGALSTSTGHLRITWSLAEAGLTLVWAESGMTGLQRPENNGFGSTIIDRILPAEIEGAVTRNFTPTGLICTIVVPNPV